VPPTVVGAVQSSVLAPFCPFLWGLLPVDVAACTIGLGLFEPMGFAPGGVVLDDLLTLLEPPEDRPGDRLIPRRLLECERGVQARACTLLARAPPWVAWA
jgi:hypothetical protein